MNNDSGKRRSLLVEHIEALAPWHMNIQLTTDLCLGEVFSPDNQIVDRDRNHGISLVDKRQPFLNALDAIYGHRLSEKTLLDCACNAGGFCFWGRERDIRFALGFDIRDHWLDQARFVQANRKVAPTDRIKFEKLDLYDLDKQILEPFSITTFTGLFDHLPDPVNGLKIAADLTSEILILNSFTTWGEADGYLKAETEATELPMSGMYGLKWVPTGPQVLARILKWLEFVEIKLRFHRQSQFDPRFGVAEIFAARHTGLLENLPRDYL